MSRTKLSLLALPLMAAIAAAPARCGDHEFDQIVHRLSAAYHKKPMPFMGLVSIAARFAQPEGVSGMRIAIFDGIDPSLSPNPGEFGDFMQDVVGSDFHPFVKVRSKHDEEQTFIYLRDAKKDSEMLVVTIDSDDAVVVQMKLNPEAMMKWVDDPVNEGRESAHNRGGRNSDW